MFQILTLNNIAAKGLAQFTPEHYTLGTDIAAPDAILLRSHDMHTMTIPDSVRLVVRAGAGTNNIPIPTLTEKGIPVLNTPGANANAVKELVITGLLLACRNIISATEFVKQLSGDDTTIHKTVESSKKQFSGFELPGKTLGVIGLGNIGVKVANAARYLDMNVIGYDPKITVQNAWELRSSVAQADSIDAVLSAADFVSIHVPLNQHTQHLISANLLQRMKKGSVLLNFARDEIVDHEALLAAIDSGHIHRYVCDFPNAAFIAHDKVICLPHLGASTQQAEENCAVMAANQIRAFLEKGHIQHAVNFPNMTMPKKNGYRISVVNTNVPNMVAQISSALSTAGYNIIDLINNSRGDIAYNLLDVDARPTNALISTLFNIEGVIRANSISS